MVTLYRAKHRRPIPTDSAPFHEMRPIFDVQNDATCTCPVRGWHSCPRHNADRYADQQARHATDSIGPDHKNYVGWAR